MFSNDQLRMQLFARYGVMVGGPELTKLLGFKTYSAFYRTWRAGRLGINVFHIPNRRGVFALTQDVADWMSQLALPEASTTRIQIPQEYPTID